MAKVAYLKFLIMKVRSKISFEASRKGHTIPEHIIKSIKDTLLLSKKAGRDDFDSDEEGKFEKLFPADLNSSQIDPQILVVS